MASLLLTQIINPALLAADFRAKTRGTAIIYPSQSLSGILELIAPRGKSLFSHSLAQCGD